MGGALWGGARGEAGPEEGVGGENYGPHTSSFRLLEERLGHRAGHRGQKRRLLL